METYEKITIGVPIVIFSNERITQGNTCVIILNEYYLNSSQGIYKVPACLLGRGFINPLW